MPRVKKPAKVKEPIRLRMKELANGNKSLYLDIYRDGKRTYEYLKMYLIPETDNNDTRHLYWYVHISTYQTSVGYCLFVHGYSRTFDQIDKQSHTFFFD